MKLHRWGLKPTLREAVQREINMGKIAAVATPADSAQDKELQALALAILDQFQEVLDNVVDR